MFKSTLADDYVVVGFVKVAEVVDADGNAVLSMGDVKDMVTLL